MPRKTLFLVLVVALAVCAAAACRWVPPTSGTKAQARRAIVGFELAKASSRPSSMLGKRLTAADKVALQTRFLRRIARYATGSEFQEWRAWDYPRALLDDERHRGEFVACAGKIVYWDFRHRTIGGRLVVRAGVGERLRMVKWDAAHRRLVPLPDWKPSVCVNDYTLEKSGGVWKVAATHHWMFWDPATRQLGTGP